MNELKSIIKYIKDDTFKGRQSSNVLNKLEISKNMVENLQNQFFRAESNKKNLDIDHTHFNKKKELKSKKESKKNISKTTIKFINPTSKRQQSNKLVYQNDSNSPSKHYVTDMLKNYHSPIMKNSNSNLNNSLNKTIRSPIKNMKRSSTSLSKFESSYENDDKNTPSSVIFGNLNTIKKSSGFNLTKKNKYSNTSLLNLKNNDFKSNTTKSLVLNEAPIEDEEDKDEEKVNDLNNNSDIKISIKRLISDDDDSLSNINSKELNFRPYKKVIIKAKKSEKLIDKSNLNQEPRKYMKFSNIYDSLSENENDIDEYFPKFYSINPKSKFSSFWIDFHIVAVSFGILYNSTLLISENKTQSTTILLIIEVIFDIIMMFNFFMNIVKGIIINNGLTNYSINTTLSHYTKSKYFIIDFLMAIPYNITKVMIILIFNKQYLQSLGFYTLNYNYLLKLFSLIYITKWIKTSYIYEGKNHQLEKSLSLENSSYNWISQIYKLASYFNIISFFIILVHFLCCIFIYIGTISIDTSYSSWIIVNNLRDKSSLELYTASLYFIFLTLLTVGYGDITPQNQYEKLFCIFLLLVGCFLYSYLIILGSVIFGEKERKIQIIEGRKKILNELNKDHKLNEDLISKLNRIIMTKNYLNWNNCLYDFLETLPNLIKNELTSQMYAQTIGNLQFFKDKSIDFIFYSVPLINAFSYLKGEIIYSYGDNISEMVLVVKGKLSVKLNRDLGHYLIGYVKENSHFGDISMFDNNTVSNYDLIVCSSISRLFILTKGSFINIRNEFKEEVEKIVENSLILYEGYEKKRLLATNYYKKNLSYNGFGTFLTKYYLDIGLFDDQDNGNEMTASIKAIPNLNSKYNSNKSVLTLNKNSENIEESKLASDDEKYLDEAYEKKQSNLILSTVHEENEHSAVLSPTKQGTIFGIFKNKQKISKIKALIEKSTSSNIKTKFFKENRNKGKFFKNQNEIDLIENSKASNIKISINKKYYEDSNSLLKRLKYSNPLKDNEHEIKNNSNNSQLEQIISKTAMNDYKLTKQSLAKFENISKLITKLGECIKARPNMHILRRSTVVESSKNKKMSNEILLPSNYKLRNNDRKSFNIKSAKVDAGILQSNLIIPDKKQTAKRNSIISLFSGKMNSIVNNDVILSEINNNDDSNNWIRNHDEYFNGEKSIKGNKLLENNIHKKIEDSSNLVKEKNVENLIFDFISLSKNELAKKQ